MRDGFRVLLALGALCGLASSAAADTVMQQCGQQYQAAKAAGTLNGMNWTQFRVDCAAKMKAQPAVAPAAAAPVTQAANPLNPAPAPVAAAPAPAAPGAAAPATPAATAAAAPAKTVSPGRQAFQERQKQCGAEWRANKATLVAQTPGLTWPHYLSQCNTRLKAAGK